MMTREEQIRIVDAKILYHFRDLEPEEIASGVVKPLPQNVPIGTISNEAATPAPASKEFPAATPTVGSTNSGETKNNS
jgi:hypothetical protein